MYIYIYIYMIICYHLIIGWVSIIYRILESSLSLSLSLSWNKILINMWYVSGFCFGTNLLQYYLLQSSDNL